MSGVFGKRWYTIQLQVITVDRTTKARAQQASGHTWSTWERRRRRGEGGNIIGNSKRENVLQRTLGGEWDQNGPNPGPNPIKSGFGVSQIPKRTEVFTMTLGIQCPWSSVLTFPVNLRLIRLIRFIRLWQSRAH